MKKFSILLIGMACTFLVSCGWRCEGSVCGWGAIYQIDTTDISLVEQNLVIVDSLLLDEYNSVKYDSLEFRGYAFEQNKEDSITLLIYEQEHIVPHHRTIAFDTTSFVSSGLSAELYHSIKFLLGHNITECLYITSGIYKDYFVHYYGYTEEYSRLRFVVFKPIGEYLVTNQYYRMYDTANNLMMIGYKW